MADTAHDVQITPQMLAKVLQHQSPQAVFRNAMFDRPQTTPARTTISSPSSVRLATAQRQLERLASKTPPSTASASTLTGSHSPFDEIREDRMVRKLQKRQETLLAKLQKQTNVSLRIGPLGFRDREKPGWADSLRPR